jgi:superoxide dismutase, Cu-Zn family
MRAQQFLAVPVLLCAAAAIAVGQTAPKSAHADIVNAQGQNIGSAKFTTHMGGVKIVVMVSGLTAGEHGIHIHTVGKCDAPDFKTAGGHFNPTIAHHGTMNAMDPHPHAGDLPNLTVGADGKGKATFTDKSVTLGPGASSLFHDGGTSLVIHAKPDDMMSDPSGNSGDRVACGVITQ